MTSSVEPRRYALPIALAASLPLATIALFAPQAITEVVSAKGYIPHGHCYLWQPRLLAVHGISDFLIGLSYLAISLTLAYLVYRARDHIPFGWLVLAFGTFIIACGMTHFMELITLWTPVYWLAGDIKVITALASVGTAIALPPLVPRILELARAQEIAERRSSELAESSALLAEEQAARTKAEEADRAKDQFLALISHELRNPLSPILAWTRMLKLETLEPQNHLGAINAIERNATALVKLIEDLLDVSRIASGKLRLEVRPTELGKVIEAAVEALGPSAETKRIRLHLVIDPRSGMVLGDPDRLQQVVANLLSNAIKFTPRGGRVHVALERINSHVELSVSDTGQGLDREALQHVFERFWQGDIGTERRHGGLGLGLCIVRELVESHGGAVHAHSDGPGKGSTFTVKLPLLDTVQHTDVDRRPPVASDGSLSGTRARLDGIKVLVVDDEPDTNEMLQAVLTLRGADVRVAASARQALDILDRWRPDLIVSDIGMPEKDGYVLIREVRQRTPARGGEIPAIALTGYARAEDRVRILTAGFQTHVAKPIDPMELIAVAASVVRSAWKSRGIDLA